MRSPSAYFITHLREINRSLGLGALWTLHSGAAYAAAISPSGAVRALEAQCARRFAAVSAPSASTSAADVPS